MPSQRDIASGLAKNGSCHGSGVVPAPAESRLAFFDVCAAHVRTNPSFGIVDETLGKLSGAWAERDDLDELLRGNRKGWKRRLKRLGLAKD